MWDLYNVEWTCCVIYRVFSEPLWQRKAGKRSELGKKVGNEQFEEWVFWLTCVRDHLIALSSCRSWAQRTQVSSAALTLLQCSICFSFYWKYSFVQCGKFGSPYLGKAQQPQEQQYPYQYASYFYVSKQVYVDFFYDGKSDHLFPGKLNVMIILLQCAGYSWVTQMEVSDGVWVLFDNIKFIPCAFFQLLYPVNEDINIVWGLSKYLSV